MFYCLAAASAERGAQIVSGQYYIKAIWCGGGRKPPLLLLVRWPAVRERSMWPWNKRHSYILSQRMLRSYSTSTLWKRWFIHSNNVLFVWQTWAELERGFLCFNSQWTGWGLHVLYSLLSKCPVELCNLVHSARTGHWRWRLKYKEHTRRDLLSDGNGYLSVPWTVGHKATPSKYSYVHCCKSIKERTESVSATFELRLR